MRGHPVEGRRSTERALAVADRIGLSGRTLAGLLTAAGWFAGVQGDLDASVAFATRGLAVAEEVGDFRNTGLSFIWLAFTASVRQQFAEADVLLRRALDLGRQADDDWLCVWALLFLGYNQIHQGRLHQARRFFEEALRISRTAGNEWFTLAAATALAEMAVVQGERDQAWELVHENLALARRRGERHLFGWLLNARGELQRLDGELPPALETFREALALARELDVKDAIQDTLDGIARVYTSQDRSREAARLLGAAEALRDRLEFPLSLAYVPRHEQTVQMVRGRLGDERLAAEWARGRAMPLEDAIEVAMEGT
jgi:tetratricopeptide (TPR) repeat protein